MTMRGLLLSVATTALLGAITMSCSDPVPPTKQGAFSVRLTAGTGMCGLPQTFIKIGDASATTHASVSDSNDPQVKCSVKQSGGSFTFDAQLTSSGSMTVFSVTGTATPGADSMASVSISNPETALNAFGGSCKLSVTKSDASPNLAVAPGRIWAAITCPAITQPGTVPLKTCALSDFDGSGVGGYFVFENCDE